MSWLRRMMQHGLNRVDDRYHRRHRLRPVGPILYVGLSPYSGPQVRFEDETPLRTGDMVATLHFNNARFTQIEAGSPTAAALGFARLMLQSMRELAALSSSDAAFHDVSVFHAVSWLPAHGHRVGFVTAPLPEGLHKHLLVLHFRLLLWTFASAEQSRSAQPDPHFYWLTRSTLQDRFASGKHIRGRPC